MDMKQIRQQMNNFNNIKMNILDQAGPRVTLNIFIDSALVHEVFDIYNGGYIYSMPYDVWTSSSKTNINFSMNKVDGYIDFMLKKPIVLKNATESPYRILVHSDCVISEGTIFQVLATANPFDSEPVWEDMTSAFLKKEYYIFKTDAENNGVYGANVRFKVDVGTSSDISWIGRFGVFLD